jgi:uncharacterized protein (DUF1778 family)
MPTIEHNSQREYARLNCRVSAQLKDQVEQAVDLLGTTITDFTEAALADKIQSVLDPEPQSIASDRNFARFLQGLKTPAPVLTVDIAMEYRRIQAECSDSAN